MAETKEWNNWSGSLSFSPSEILTPESEEELSALVKKAAEENRKVRVVGAGHSSSPLVSTDDLLISMMHFKGVEAHDTEGQRATVLSGMTVHESGKELARYKLAMHNTGDVDVQTVAGAIGTGTHGTGKSLQNLSSMLAGARIITGTGEIIEVSEDDDPELLRALRVALGTCGIFTKMRLKLVPKFDLHRQEWCVPTNKCLQNLDELINNNRNFDFYWYPRSDLSKIRIMNEVGQQMSRISYGKLEREQKGPGHEILPRERPLKFDEMEYSLPAEAGPECFEQVREQIKNKYRKEVAWRVLYRTVKADDNMLSTVHNRDTVTISLHHNAGLPFWDFFKGIEPIFRDFGGRPHWGKKHTLQAEELQILYPEWEKFHSYRRKLDPHNVFLTPYLQQLLIGGNQ